MKIIAGIFGILFVVLSASAEAEAPPRTFSCERVVSFAPSITEILFELGLGSHLVGGSRYDTYPPEAVKLPKIGGFLDPNYEAVLALKPTLVFILEEQRDQSEFLSRINVPSIVLNHKNVEGILDSIKLVGVTCGAEAKALSLTGTLRADMKKIEASMSALPRVKTLVVVGEGGESLSSGLFISGGDGFYADLLRIAGGESVYVKATSNFAALSEEGIIKLAPDAIIEIVTDPEFRLKSDEEIKKPWAKLRIPASQHGKITILRDEVYSVPGPRFPIALNAFAKALHPEAYQ